MKVFLIVIICLASFYVLSLCGKRNNKQLQKFKNAKFAHRGLHNSKQGIPENSLLAFQKAAEMGYGAELDVHLLKDGKLAVIHDSSLKRTAGADVLIEDLTEAELSTYHLEGTDQKIPTLKQVLNIYENKGPLLIELKTAGNATALCKALAKELKSYRGDFLIESFDPRCVLWFKYNKPDIVRGLLSENFAKTKSAPSALLGFMLSVMPFLFLIRPDFVAYNFKHRKFLSNVIATQLWKIQGVSWTLRNKADYETALSEGLIPIFEDFLP